MPTNTSNNYQALSTHDTPQHDSDDDDDDDDEENEYEPNEEKKAVTGKTLSRNQRKKEAAKRLKRSLSAIEAEDTRQMIAGNEEHHFNDESDAEACVPVPCHNEAVAEERRRKPKAKVKFMANAAACTHGCCNFAVKELEEGQDMLELKNIANHFPDLRDGVARDVETLYTKALNSEPSSGAEPASGLVMPGTVRHDAGDTDQSVGLFEYFHDEELNAVIEEVEIEVAQDSGSCAHVVGPGQVPSTVEIKKSPTCKNFTGAGGDGIKNHGKAEVMLVMENGETVNSVVQVAEVTRALHSTGLICDTKKEVLFTETEAVVVPAGTLSKPMGSIKRIAEYKRKGGLYVAKMKIRRRVQPGSPKAAPFGGQGDNR